MDTYQWSTAEKRSLDEIDLGFRRYRIHRKRAEETMAQSLRRYGQLSPVVICDIDGRPMLVDGFKRHTAAQEVKGIDSLWTRQLEVDVSTAGRGGVLRQGALLTALSYSLLLCTIDHFPSHYFLPLIHLSAVALAAGAGTLPQRLPRWIILGLGVAGLGWSALFGYAL